MPPVLLGAVHFLLFDGLDHPLGDVYGGRSSADPGPLFVRFCRQHHGALSTLIEVRRLQTNEVRRLHTND